MRCVLFLLGNALLLVLLLALLQSAALVSSMVLCTGVAECKLRVGAATAAMCKLASKEAAWLGQGILTVASLASLLRDRGSRRQVRGMSYKTLPSSSNN